MEPRPGTELVHDIRVTWGDCDPARIAYTGRLPWFALDAINAWWLANTGGDGWFQMEIDHNIGTPFVRLEMDFKRPVTPRHILHCHVWPCALGTTSISFRVDGVQAGQTCFSGRFTCVFIVADLFTKQPPPAHLRDMIRAHIPPGGVAGTGGDV